eukprot:COSAG04_NODE_5176_length_1713_cov_1.669145_1_plen_80_part_10
MEDFGGSGFAASQWRFRLELRMEPEPEPEPEPAEPSALAAMAGLGCDERAAALSWYAPESQRRDAAQSARQEQARAAAQA